MIHPFASVTVTVSVPAHIAVSLAVVPPLVHEYVYVVVPPVVVTSAVPSHTVAHNGSVLEVIAAVKTAGSVKVIDTEATHPTASVTSTV